MDRQNFLGENYGGKFPISVNTLAFMQNQTEFVSQIAAAFGKNVILKKASINKTDGLIVIDGELLPLQYTSNTTGYYGIIKTSESVVAQNTEYDEARTTRVAALYASQSPYPKSMFVDLTGGQYTSPVTLANHFMPKGAIIMWSGSWSNIPNGFALCNGNNGEAINGVAIPDLRGRFVVGGNSGSSEFNVSGKTGGSMSQTLTINNMPKHRHKISIPSDKTNGEGNYVRRGLSDFSGYLQYWSDFAGLDNPAPTSTLPPYYVLAFLIKVI